MSQRRPAEPDPQPAASGPPTAFELMRVWDWGRDRGPADRGLALLALAVSDGPDARAALTIGQRDAHLLRLRCALFGETFDVRVACPACAEELEFHMTGAELSVADPAGIDPGPHTIEVDDYTLEVRLPDSRDLATVEAFEAPAEARAKLLQRCVVSVAGPDGDLVESLPAELADAITDAIAERDPQAHIRFQLTCAACAHAWVSHFDIVGYFWDEITAQVKQWIREVHALAAAYGWSERDILSMSAARRRLYLDLLEQ